MPATITAAKPIHNPVYGVDHEVEVQETYCRWDADAARYIHEDAPEIGGWMLNDRSMQSVAGAKRSIGSAMKRGEGGGFREQTKFVITIQHFVGKPHTTESSVNDTTRVDVFCVDGR